MPEENEFDEAQVGLMTQVGHVDLSDDMVAQRALAGEYVRIMEREEFYDQFGRLQTVDDAAIGQFAENWMLRTERGIRRSRLAVDQKHDGKAVGWYKDIVGRDDGLYASFSWTMKGRKILEEGEYAYFSPTVYWMIRDRKTGEMIQNQIGGGALTNYPYLGESTALMSNRDSSEEGANDMPGQDEGNVQQVDVEELTNGVVARLLARFTTTDGEGDAPPEIDIEALRADLTNELEVVRTERQTVEATYESQITELQGRVAAAELARQREGYRATVLHRFNHLPGEQDELVGHIAWLHNVDNSDDAAHATYFMTLLEQADSQFSRQFESRGVRQDVTRSAGSFEQIDTRIRAHMSDNPDATYEDAAGAVFAANPELASQHFDSNNGGA